MTEPKIIETLPEMASMLQAELDESWQTFVEAHDLVCNAGGHAVGVSHQRGLWSLVGDLESCPEADTDAMSNFAYGTILSCRHLATHMGLDMLPTILQSRSN